MVIIPSDGQNITFHVTQLYSNRGQKVTAEQKAILNWEILRETTGMKSNNFKRENTEKGEGSEKYKLVATK